MKCTECRSSKMKKRTLKRHVFMDSPRVYVSGIDAYTCKNCGEEFIDFPRMGQLMNLVAKEIASQRRRLTGDEVGFLRSFVGMTMEELAHSCGVNKSTVSRWEKGDLPPHSDKLLRYTILNAAWTMNGKEPPLSLMRLLAEARLEKKAKPKPMRFTSGEAWSIAV